MVNRERGRKYRRKIRADGQKYRRNRGWAYGQKGVRIDGHAKKTDEKMNGETDGNIDRNTDGKTDEKADGETDGQTKRASQSK